MNNSNTQKTHKFKAFMKKYAYTIVLLVGLASAILLITLTRKTKSAVYETVPDESVIVTENVLPVDTTVEEITPVSEQAETVFQNPVATAVVVRDYSDEEFVNFVSLGYFAIHKAVDFSGEGGTAVFSAAKGKVLSVETTSNRGTTVVIEHENGFKTSYSSLDSNVEVKAGDSVKAGQQIGSMSNSMLDEAELGVHLHFELFKDGALVDPNLYLTLSNK